MAAPKSHVPAIVKCAFYDFRTTEETKEGLGLVAMGLALGHECLGVGLCLETLSLESKSDSC